MKKVVIMGASSGIGLAVAEAFASRGVKVGLAARHTEAMADLKKRYHGLVETARIDITRPEATGELHRLIDRLGGMDVYLHVAGIGYDNPTLDPEREVAMVSTNATAFARMCSTAYLWFRNHGVRGRLAAVTSVAGTKGTGRLAAYSASKKFDQTYLVALEQLSRIEGAGVSFTDIRPGWVSTPLLKDGVKYPMEMSLDYVVPQIVAAILKRRRVAVIDWRWGLLTAAWRILPNALWTRLDIPITSAGGAKEPEKK